MTSQLRRPGARGWAGRGGGRSIFIQAPDEWRGTTVQVCGLWPFAAGSGSPMVGVPVGRHLLTGATVCADPISWFERGQLINNPSAFLLGLPGLGKSTLARRMVLGLAGYGVTPVILGDLKPDYVDLIKALGGQVITLGRGRGHLNVLDPGQATAAATRLTGTWREQVRADAHGRRLNIVAGLLQILRAAPLTDREETILDQALRVLDDRHVGVPVLADLLAVIRDAPDPVRQVALDRGNPDRYRDLTEHLEASLIGLIGGGRLGQIFAAPTTEPMMADRPVAFDVSAIADTDAALQAAVLLACWSAGFATINIATLLADAGLTPRRNHLIVLDELWRGLRAGQGMVDRVDAATRLNRTWGVGTVMISHTMADLTALPDVADRQKARGFVERSGMVIAGGLPHAEMGPLSSAVALTAAEQDMLVSWSSPPSWDSRHARQADPPGRGKFLLKVGGKPGIPIHVDLTSVEHAVNDTNKRWNRLRHPSSEPRGVA